MGQYYKVCNITKGEFIEPHAFNDGAKLMEFGMSAMGTMTALAVLLSSGNGRGGGDLNSDSTIVGSWAGDQIVIAGDYADDGLYVPDGFDGNLYQYAYENYRDIAPLVWEALLGDVYIQRRLEEESKSGYISSSCKEILTHFIKL